MSEATMPSTDVVGAAGATPTHVSSSSSSSSSSDNNKDNEDLTALAVPEGEEEKEEEGELDTKTFKEKFGKVFDGYGQDYMKKVMELSKQAIYTITLNVPDPSGKKEPDPWEEGKERDVYIGTEQKQYKRRPISAQDFHRAEKLRAKFQNEKDPDKVADNQARIYQFLSFCYLGMTPAEFSRVADWTELKLAIDACNHKTIYQPGSSS